MKRALNSYSARNYTIGNYSIPLAGSQTAWMFPRIPNYVWLALLILTIGAFSYSAYNRSRQQEQEAQESYNNVQVRVENAKNVNRQIREQTERIRMNPETSAQVAQDQLRLVRRNEIIVSLR